MNIIYVIFKQLDSEKIWMQISEDTYILNSNLKSRAAAFDQFPNFWICFFDHDCIFDKEIKNEIEQKLTYYQTDWILAGLYNNPVQATRLQFVHNFICNEWVLQNAEAEIKFFLGGFFAIYSGMHIRQIDYSHLPRWGGEDKMLAIILQNNNFKIRIEKNIFVEHQTSKSIRHFIRRSFLHGINSVQYNLNEKSSAVKKIIAWNQKLKTLGWSFRCLAYIHFSILTLAIVFQIIHPKNNLKSLK